jgi:hypothetical protein
VYALVAAFLLVAIVVLIALAGGGDDDSTDTVTGSVFQACILAVPDYLASPSSASFPLYGDRGTGVFYNADTDKWTATGFVDADNSFGANLRTTWTCSVRHSGDQYEVLDVQIDG